jgi:hypothetical protein
MRLIRTIAKRSRKKLYYDRAIKNLIYTVELLAKEGGYKISDENNIRISNPQLPAIAWQDGIVNDEVERTDIAIKKIDSGIMSRKQAVTELEGLDEPDVEELLKQVDEEKANFISIYDKKDEEED